MNELHLFAGAGGGILGGMLLGHSCICAVEIEPYCRRILLQRQRDGILPRFPIWDDVRTFDGTPWRGHVDVICGGFPCQDISAAGKGAGIDGERSGLWSEFARIIREVRPRYVFVENSPMLTSRGLHRVLGDLAAMGFDAEWGVLGADDAGAPHLRKRIWILGNSTDWNGKIPSVLFRPRKRQPGGTSWGGALCTDELADANRERQLQPQGRESDERGWIGDGGGEMADAEHARPDDRCAESHGGGFLGREGEELADSVRERGRGSGHELGESQELRQRGTHSAGDGYPWNGGDPADNPRGSESFVGRVADGVAHRVDRLRAIGNGQVSAVAALAWRILMERSHAA